MIKKSLLVLPVILFFTACTSTQTVVQRSSKVINGSGINNINDNNEVVISYEDYLKKYENKNPYKNKEDELSNPIITPEEYKELISVKKEIKPTKKTTYTLKNKNDVRSALMDFYKEWKDVKYKFGGSSKKGIDCSAFTQKIFKEKFNIKIPRSTRTQVNSGEKIKKSQLKLGDLVFFKTGKIDRHVGIYMGDGNFMHASIKGIKFTKLDKPFYEKTYWTSRRILN